MVALLTDVRPRDRRAAATIEDAARASGGIGRRAGFRTLWGQPRGGSSPLSPTGKGAVREWPRCDSPSRGPRPRLIADGISVGSPTPIETGRPGPVLIPTKEPSRSSSVRRRRKPFSVYSNGCSLMTSSRQPSSGTRSAPTDESLRATRSFSVSASGSRWRRPYEWSRSGIASRLTIVVPGSRMRPLKAIPETGVATFEVQLHGESVSVVLTAKSVSSLSWIARPVARAVQKAITRRALERLVQT